jgi:hypothetical protein
VRGAASNGRPYRVKLTWRGLRESNLPERRLWIINEVVCHIPEAQRVKIKGLVTIPHSL